MAVVGIDVWDGSFSQVNNYARGSGRNVTYPLAMQGAFFGNAWNNIDRSSIAIVDASGVIQYITPQSTRYSSRYETHKQEVFDKLDELLTTTNVTEEASNPKDFSLQNNAPNPFVDRTVFKFNLGPGAEKNVTKLTIYDLLGREIKSIINAPLAGGAYNAAWDGRNGKGAFAPAGIYFYVLTSGRERIVKRLVFLRGRQ